MKLQFWSIGKPHEAYIKAGVDEFTGRVNKYFGAEWLIIPPPKNAAVLKEPELKKQECKAVTALLQKDDVLVLLDERGKMFSSPEVAALLQQQANESAKRVVFLIGGAFGVDEELKKKSQYYVEPLQTGVPTHAGEIGIGGAGIPRLHHFTQRKVSPCIVTGCWLPVFV